MLRSKFCVNGKIKYTIRLIVKAFYPQAFNNLQQTCKYQVASSLVFIDLKQIEKAFMQPDEKLALSQ